MLQEAPCETGSSSGRREMEALVGEGRKLLAPQPTPPAPAPSAEGRRARGAVQGPAPLQGRTPKLLCRKHYVKLS